MLPVCYNETMNMKTIAVMALSIAAGAAIGYYFGYDSGWEGAQKMKIADFDDCATAGYPIMESYPEQCRTPDGKTFVRQIEAKGGIQGIVLLGPTCPVVQDPPEEECADRPFQTTLAVTTSDGARVIKKFSSGADGKFSTALPAGEYSIRSAAAANILPYCSSESFTVSEGAYTEVAVYCDSGIR